MQKILIVEDEDEIRTGLRYFFEASGFIAAEAVNGLQALEVLKNETPDLIISDIMMPGLDGFELIKLVKGNLCTKSIPFVFLTARTSAEEIREGYDLGADGYITKPFSLIDLMDTVNIFLKESI